jgi:hypothetical protein
VSRSALKRKKGRSHENPNEFSLYYFTSVFKTSSDRLTLKVKDLGRRQWLRPVILAT